VELPHTILHWFLGAAAGGALSFFCVGLTSYFERRNDRPLTARLVHDSASLLAMAHLGSVLFLAPASDLFAGVGIVMYTACVAVMLATIEAADRTRLQRAFVDHPLPDRLITTGPYRWVRHPFYVAYIIGALAPAVGVQHPFIIVVSAIMIALVVVAARREERVWLASPKADAYRDYQKRTGMFIPFVGRA
jgi:protein-S-isoprenylcysteine O-methyltransferase Ste14